MYKITDVNISKVLPMVASLLLLCLHLTVRSGRYIKQLLLFQMTPLHYSTLQFMMSHHFPGISHLQQTTSEQLNTSSEFLSPTDTPETDHRTKSIFSPILFKLEDLTDLVSDIHLKRT